MSSAMHHRLALRGRLPLRLAERRAMLVVGDLVVLSQALYVALHVGLVGLNRALAASVGVRPLWWVVLAMVWLVIADTTRLFDLNTAASPTKSAATAALAAVVACTLYLFIPVWSAPLTFSRVTWMGFVALSAGGMALWRGLYGKVLTQSRYSRKTAIIGADETALELMEVFAQEGIGRGHEFVGMLPLGVGVSEGRVRAIASPGQLVDMAEALELDDIVVSVSGAEAVPKELADALLACWRRGVHVVPLVDYYERTFGYIPAKHVGHNVFALVSSEHGLGQLLWEAASRAADVLFALLGLAFLGCLLPFLTLAIWVDCPGPVFYRQQRVGLNGRVFTIAKLRTMRPDAEADGNSVWAGQNDCRVTRVGRLLRRSRLDELPQLLNVLVGEMSFIGPRPERPKFVSELKRLLPYYDLRHAVKPGLTGWAQVRYGYGGSVDDALAKLQYDLYYVRNRGPYLDALILLHTLSEVVWLRGR